MELQCSSSHSQISNCFSAYARKAWHIASVLTSLGRPVCLSDLVERFALLGLSREFVEFLCWIPNSPLLLTDKGHITLSPVALMALGRFFVSSMLRVEARDWTMSSSSMDNVFRTYYRKRKRLGEAMLPLMKKKVSDSRFSEEKAVDEVPYFCRTIAEDIVQVYDDLCSPDNRTVIVPTSPTKVGAFHPRSIKDRMIVDPLKLNCRITTKCIQEKENKMEQSTPSVDHVSMQGKSPFQLDRGVRPVRGVQQQKPGSQDQHRKSIIKIIINHQDGLDLRFERELLEGSNESLLKNNISNQENGNFCSNSFRNLQRKSPSKTMKHQLDLLVQEAEQQSEKVDDDILKGKCLRRAVAIPTKNKTKQLLGSKNSIEEKNDHIDSKALPKFDLYTIEDEEGSGGYGTVYRAQRKSDGIKFAIKYPHPNANKHHIDNERKFLERFGGKDFIIKYEGSCKTEKSDCLILKHVEHDRPDVLKKDIGVSELQWYGYCMFTALRSLHLQGVVHRDVKPGNFLFSRKTCLGYIIDFNLAKALYPKQANAGIYLNPHCKTASPSKRRKIPDTKAPELGPVGSKRGYKPIESKMLKSLALENNRNSIPSQGAEISGLTYVKDKTSTKTPSKERLREPLPCHGRKEFINLAQEAMQTLKQEAAGVSSYKRKRIAAPSATMGRKLAYCTPMPINSSGIAIQGSGLLKEGAGKKQKEGSCSGTKGFRAPEVLLRSMHQGPKLDVWSAGVTFLYLMTAKMPFNGDPEQNMKDIVHLRGSEELWELAKLHDRESSFPKELYDVQYLQSMELREWCKANTRRPEFFKAIPSALFDLVDKCLTVNPRLRISAEEALRHEFFAPCIDTVMRRKRLLKQQVSSKSSSNQ